MVAIFCSFSKSPLFLVSLDGFRAEYLKDHSTHIPVISKLRKSATMLIPELVVVVFGQLEEWQTTTLLQERLGPQQRTWGLSILQRPSPTITPLSLWVIVFICEAQKFMRLNTAAKRYFTSKMTFPFRIELFSCPGLKHLEQSNYGNIKTSTNIQKVYRQNRPPSADMLPTEMESMCATDWKKQKLHLAEQLKCHQPSLAFIL